MTNAESISQESTGVQNIETEEPSEKSRAPNKKSGAEVSDAVELESVYNNKDNIQCNVDTSDVNESLCHKNNSSGEESSVSTLNESLGEIQASEEIRSQSSS
mmetsp:Transcript_3286/g.4609  ORF Transcript_3286/g.4609 Transcript_3286/m.4609 type:complete len:102 (-) Transcript_3286:25-330(-)